MDYREWQTQERSINFKVNERKMARPIEHGTYALRSILEAQQAQSQTDRFRGAYLAQTLHTRTTYSVIPDSLKLSFTGWNDATTTWNTIPFADFNTCLGGGDTQKVVFENSSIQEYSGLGQKGLRPLLNDVEYIGFYKSRLESGSMADWFHNCQTLKNIDMFLFDTSKATHMSCLFSGCSLLTDLDISTWDTSNVVDMESMFHGCAALPWLNVSSFNTSKVNNMNHMFRGLSIIEELDLSSFNLASLTTAWWMFEGCSNLRRLILKGAAIKKLASLDYEPPLEMTGYASLNDNQIYVLSGSVQPTGDVHAFVVGAIPAQQDI